MPKDELIEKVARAIEQPFLPHGYELKPHLLKAAAKAAISALPQDEEVERDALETARQRAIVLFQAYARGVALHHGRSETQFISDVTAFANELADALQIPISARAALSQETVSHDPQ